MPLARDVVKDLAIEHGACIRPVQLRRTSLDTRTVDQVLVPCGRTLATVCPACAQRAKTLRAAQCREGWHLETEPVIDPDPATEDQKWWVEKRAEAQAMHDQAEKDGEDTEDFDGLNAELDQEIKGAGMRGNVLPARATRRHRTTRRRQDAAPLPLRKVAARTVGKVYETADGKRFRPSLFVTLTCPSYGRVREDGTPADPAAYDYVRAARDALHFAALFDRFIQNLRRFLGYDVQYFAAVEPQRRLALHIHLALRGTVSRAELRRVLAATYHQVWWPDTSVVRFEDGALPVWDEAAATYLDPATGEVLPTWDQALDAIGDQDEPLHVARFGDRFDAQGVLGGSKDAARCIGYLTKYLTKQVADCHQAQADAERAHVERLADALRFEPCSPRCANWLRYGIQPMNARAGLIPGACKGKAHRREYLGYAGRRVLVSRKWSGKTLLLTGPTARTGCCPRLASRPTRPGTPGSPSRPATRTTWNTPGDCCTSSPTASTGKPPLPKPDAGQASNRPAIFRQPGRRHDPGGRQAGGGAAAHSVRGRRDPQYQRAFPAPSDRGTPHPLRSCRTPCPHPRVRAARVHRGGAHRNHHHYEEEGGSVMGKRRFGRVRRLPSGQYQARYAGPDGIDRPAPQTFTSKGDAEIWLTMKEAEIRRGDWTDLEAGKVRFGDYAANWVSDHVFKPRTEGLYRSQLKNHLAPTFGKKDLRDIHEADVRRWRKERLDEGPHAARPFGPVTVAKAYRLLHAIMNTAVEDGLIRRNPCRIKGAGQEYSQERPVVPVGTLVRLIDEVPPRYRALLLLATFANLRFGELAGLRRDQLDLDKCLVRVAVSTAEMDDGRLIDAGPKSWAGTRVVAFPREIMPELRWHLECFAQGEKDGGLVFVGPLGGRLRRSNFRRLWHKARDAVGLPELHLLSRPGARFRCCHRPVSPDRSPNPPYRSPGNGLSTVPAVRRGSWSARGLGSCCPGRSNGRPLHSRSGRTRSRPLRCATARWRRSGGGGAGPSSSRGVPSACGRASRR